MTPLPKCGCKITCRFDGIGQSEYDGEIEYCPMHRAAPALLAALKNIYHSLRLSWFTKENAQAIAKAAIEEAGKA